MIKFVGGPHKAPANVVAGVHPCAPDNLRPGVAAAVRAPSAPITVGPFQDRNSLSQRFRYKVPDDIEIENIASGGAEYYN